MANDVRVDLEVQRLLNLVRGFGWEMIEQRVTDEGITVILKRVLPMGVPAGAG